MRRELTEQSSSRLPGDGCDRDWIWARDVETASPEALEQRARISWDRQFKHLTEGSAFYRRKFAAAGVGDSLVKLGDLAALPFTTKDELKLAIDEAPPFGSNLCVPEAAVKRVYQTSGTAGTPSVIALTAADVETWTAIGTRTYYATGIHDHHSVLSTFGAGPFVAGHTQLVLIRIGARTVPVGPGDTGRVRFALSAGIADTLLCTPSFAQYLANRFGREGTIDALTHVVTGGEPGGGIKAVRDHIQTVLGATVNEVMGLGDVAPSLFGECPLQKGMHFCGAAEVWPELVDPDTRRPMAIETGAVGELVYTSLVRQAMPVVRFLGGDVIRIEGVSCDCGRTGFRMRCLGRRDDMFIVRGVNVYPAAILAILGEFRPRATGRARVVRPAGAISVEPPVPVEVEVPPEHASDPVLAAQIESAVRARLTFRCSVRLVPEHAFGDSGYKTRLTVEPDSEPGSEPARIGR